MSRKILITGAAGNVGAKLAAYLRARGGYELTLLDLDPRGDPAVVQADLADAGPWRDLFSGVDVVVHLAANPSVQSSWEILLRPNLDALLQVYAAARAHGVKKVVLASSVWAMAARHGDHDPIPAGPAEPGDIPYGIAKAFAERVAQAYVRYGVDTVAIRLGACRPGANPAVVLNDRWEDDCWISDTDTCNGFERAILADIKGVAVVNLTSITTPRRWSLAEARALIGYRPVSRLRPTILRRVLRKAHRFVFKN